ncbi:MAG TPA: hypothetical protein EYP34_08190 [Chromatiaceae bacterium]|nr:hypothetical protein [Chromatiaceae bacterium]
MKRLHFIRLGICLLLLGGSLLVYAGAAMGATCEPLPPANGNIVNVDSVSSLRAAVNNALAGDDILIADGVYNLNGVYLRIDVPNITLRSASGNRNAVILDGNYQTTEIIQIAASNITIADITLREAYYHPIHVMSSDTADTRNTLIYNVRIIDPGEQAIKINPTGAGFYPDEGTIACSHIELTNAGRPHIRNNCYTGGIDAHQAEDWVIRDNRIEGFWCESGLSEHGIHLWRGSRGTLVERNVLNNNARGIGFGLVTSGNARTYPDSPCPAAGGSYVDHYDGIVRNNFVFANEAALFASNDGFDCGICIWQACGAKVLNNTVASTAAPLSSIEWRFDNTSVDIRNNIVSHNLRHRGGSANLENNIEQAPLAMFADGSNGDLHLIPSATIAIDQASVLADVADDIDGELRSAATPPDIGADEHSPFDCSGDSVGISTHTFGTNTKTTCIAQTSITIGPNVTAKTNAEVTLISPLVRFGSQVHIEPGAVLQITQPSSR